MSSDLHHELPDTLPGSTVTAYAFGSVGTGVFSTVPGLVLAFFLTDTLGVAAGLAAAVVAVPKAWDVFALPTVGRLSDRAAGRTGTRIPFLVGGGIALVIVFILMFAVPPSWGEIPAAAWVFVMFLIASTAFAFFQVPYIALSAEVTKTAPQRAILMGRRVVFLTVAILLSGAVAPLIRDALGGQRLGYFVMAIAMAALMGLGILLCIRGLRRAPTVVRPQAEGSFVAQAKAVAGQRPFVILLSAFFLQALATAGETLGFALGPALVLGILAITGFVSTTSGQEVAQPSSAITGVGVTMSVLPAILTAISFVFILRYDLDESLASYEGVDVA